MREVIIGTTETVKYWTREVVYSVHSYYTLVITQSKFFHTDGSVATYYNGDVYCGNEYRATTNQYRNMNQMVADFQKLLGW